MVLAPNEQASTRRRVLSAVAWVAIGAILWEVGVLAKDAYQARHQPVAADVFVYHSIEYRGRNDDGTLTFESDSEYLVPNDGVTWLDRLICDGRVRSSLPNAGDPRGPVERNRVLWDYTADAPAVASNCVLSSYVVVDYQGRSYAQRLESPPFDIP